MARLTGLKTRSGNPCVHNIAIHRGHLIAAQYKPTNNKFTFVFTNSIPQFGTANSGGWNQHEQKMLLWANKNCQSAPIHIIVGVIPSTYGANDFRFVGQAGFSNHDGPSKRSPADRPYLHNIDFNNSAFNSAIFMLLGNF